jgi:hypothetical protein
VEAGVKAQDGGAQQALQQFARQGQMPKDSGLGQGMCQKVRMVACGSFSRTMAGSRAKW